MVSGWVAGWQPESPGVPRAGPAQKHAPRVPSSSPKHGGSPRSSVCAPGGREGARGKLVRPSSVLVLHHFLPHLLARLPLRPAVQHPRTGGGQPQGSGIGGGVHARRPSARSPVGRAAGCGALIAVVGARRLGAHRAATTRIDRATATTPRAERGRHSHPSPRRRWSVSRAVSECAPM